MVADFSTAKWHCIGPLFDFALVPRHGRATAGVAPLHGVWYHGDGGGGLLL